MRWQAKAVSAIQDFLGTFPRDKPGLFAALLLSLRKEEAILHDYLQSYNEILQKNLVIRDIGVETWFTQQISSTSQMKVVDDNDLILYWEESLADICENETIDDDLGPYDLIPSDIDI